MTSGRGMGQVGVRMHRECSLQGMSRAMGNL